MKNLMLFPIHDPAERPDNVTIVEFDNALIRASAGTGKTYQLTSRYLKLLLHGVTLDSILATTFTRKAAGEILDRVVVRLAQAATNEHHRLQLATAVDLPQLSEEHCREKLQYVTRQIHQLRILTLDAFFLQLATSFTLELGLTPGWQVLQDESEATRLRDEAIADVLQLENLDDLLTLVHQLTPKGPAKRSLALLLRGQVSDAYQLYLDSGETAWNQLNPPRPLSEAELNDVVQQIREFVPLKQHIALARDKDVERIVEDNWKALLESGLTKTILQGGETYSRSPIPDELLVLYRRYLDHLKATTLQMAASQTRGTWTFLNKYHQQVDRIKSDRLQYAFEDVTRMLAKHLPIDKQDALTYRLESTIDHLLLDEFQDTSIPQWLAISSLAERTAMDPGKSFFCVGDVKQSIYSWRGATSEIFELLATRLHQLPTSTLQESRRSSPILIDTVNKVFQSLPTWSALARAKRAANRFEFPTHTTVHSDMPGYVSVEVAEEDEDSSAELQTAMVFRRVAKLVAQLSNEVPDKSIAVLCRSNGAVARVMHELLLEGVSASEEGGNYLTDSASVELVLSLLHLVDHPGDSVCAYHLASSPWGPQLGLSIDLPNQDARSDVNLDNSPSANDSHVAKLKESDDGDDNAMRTESLPATTGERVPPGGIRRGAINKLVWSVRQRLHDVGLGTLLQQWEHQLRPFCNARESRRLTQLVEKAFEFQGRIDAPRQTGFQRQLRRSTRATEFVRYIRTNKFSDASENLIRAMTVHQSKGLEFDIVVLPNLVEPLVGTNEAFLYRRPSIESDIDMVCRYVGHSGGRQFLSQPFQQLFDDHDDRKAQETLCWLYVAMTRAVHALHMVLPAGKPRRGHETADALIRAALCPNARIEPGQTLCEFGDKHWYRHDSQSSVPTRNLTVQTSTPELRLAKKPPKRRYLDTIAPSQHMARPTIRIQDRFAGSADPARHYGVLLHLLLSKIQWLVPGKPLPDAEEWRKIGQSFTTLLDLETAINSFREHLESDLLTSVLVRDVYEIDLRRRLPNLPAILEFEIRNEQPVAGHMDSAILSGTVDRLVIVREANEIVAADILDYKTSLDADTSMEESEDKRVQRYANQMAMYERIVATSLRLSPKVVSHRMVLIP